MPLFTWNNEYSVGVGDMDSHHKKLFDIINQLHDAMKDGHADDQLAAIIRELVDYTKYHFGEEEKLMEQINYVGLGAQRGEHQAFISKMGEYMERVNKGQAAFTVAEVAETSVHWLREHIVGMDRKYQKAMNDSGIS